MIVLSVPFFRVDSCFMSRVSLGLPSEEAVRSYWWLTAFFLSCFGIAITEVATAEGTLYLNGDELKKWRARHAQYDHSTSTVSAEWISAICTRLREPPKKKTPLSPPPPEVSSEQKKVSQMTLEEFSTQFTQALRTNDAAGMRRIFQCCKEEGVKYSIGTFELEGTKERLPAVAYCAYKGFVETARVLLENGQSAGGCAVDNFNNPTEMTLPPLFIAALMKHPNKKQLMQLLIDFKADVLQISAPMSNQAFLLRRAGPLMSDLETICFLLENAKSIQAVADHVFTHFCFDVPIEPHVQLIKLLIYYGVEPKNSKSAWLTTDLPRVIREATELWRRSACEILFGRVEILNTVPYEVLNLILEWSGLFLEEAESLKPCEKTVIAKQCLQTNAKLEALRGDVQKVVGATIFPDVHPQHEIEERNNHLIMRANHLLYQRLRDLNLVRAEPQREGWGVNMLIARLISEYIFDNAPDDREVSNEVQNSARELLQKVSLAEDSQLTQAEIEGIKELLQSVTAIGAMPVVVWNLITKYIGKIDVDAE